MTEYALLVSEIKASFNFEVLCSINVVSSTVTVPIKASNIYDVANPNGLIIPIMELSLNPSACKYSVEKIELSFKKSPGEEPPFISADVKKG